MKVNADSETLEPVEFLDLKVGDEVFVVTKHQDGQTFIAQASLTHTDWNGSWKSGDLVIVTHPDFMNNWVRDNREIYRKKFVFPKAWGSVISVFDDELQEERRFVKLVSSWSRESDSAFYTEDKIRQFYPGKITTIRDGI